MNIALLTEKYTPDIGGLAISSGRLAKLLTSAGHKVRIFAPTLSLPASDVQVFVQEGISITRFGAHKRIEDTLVDWFELIVSEHQHEPFDLLQAYFLPQAGFIAAYAGKYLGIPGVVSARGNDLERAVFSPDRATHIFYALQHASAVATNTTEMVKKARALIPGLEVNLIHNSVDTGHFRPLPKNEPLAETLGIGERPVIGFVGELREKKGLLILLDSYTQLNKKTPATLFILGDVRPGEDKIVFDEYRKAHPDAHIIVTGFISHTDLPQYYSLIDVQVIPSLRDGLPNALLEGMACQKTIIAARVGGIADVIKNGENGRLVPVRDSKMLAKVLYELLKDKNSQAVLGKAGRETVVNNFPQHKELDENLALFRRLVNR